MLATWQSDCGRVSLYCGDCAAILPVLDLADAVVCDPPYGLSFMGKKWDCDVPEVDVWRACFRVLRPGGHLLSFAGTRTQHRMAVNIEDAGFEIRDMIAWVYGSGFPKSLDVSKAIDKAAGVEFDAVPASGVGFMNAEGAGGYNVTKNSLVRKGESTAAARQWQGWGTALKPALEPITVARKPLCGTVAENVLQHGIGALNVDGCRVEPTGESRERVGELSQDRRYTDNGGTNFAATPGIRGGDPSGRWPANLIHDGSSEPVELLGDSARFFYCAKTSKRDREEGMEDEPDRVLARSCQAQAEAKRGNVVDAESGAFNKARARKNNHPTVKPTDLMRYLCRLVTPPNGVVLDPFMGSGSTGKAAILEGFKFIGIERDQEYFEIAKRRIQYAIQTAGRQEKTEKLLF